MIHIEPSNEQTSRSDLIAAFKRVIKRAGRPQATDLHVRRLLLYVQAKDHDGTGLQRSLQQLSDKLYLTESTCRRVVRRATKKFGLLTVTEQRHTPGGQVANRYSINWKQVDALLCDEHPENTPVTGNKFQRSSGSPESRATLISRRALAAVSTERTGLNPSLASYNNFARQARTRTQNKRIHPSHLESRATHISRMPVRLAPDLCPGASSCCWPKHMQLTSSNSSDAPVPIEQPDNTTARAARSPRISNFDFSPPNFTPDALSDQAPDLKSRARSKRILHSSEGTRFPSPMRHVVHESQYSTTPRSTSYRVLSAIMRPRTTFLSLCQSGSTPGSTDVPIGSSDLSSSTLPYASRATTSDFLNAHESQYSTSPRSTSYRMLSPINRLCVPPRPLR